MVDIKLEILRLHHDVLLAGHPGTKKTLALISRTYTWPQMRGFIQDYVSSCDTCARVKSSRHKPYGLLQSLPIPPTPWSSVSMDFIVGLPASRKFTGIMVVVDRLTKMAHFMPITENNDAPTTATLFLKEIVRVHGLPTDIVSDRGSVFLSKFWKSLLSAMHIKQNLSTAH